MIHCEMMRWMVGEELMLPTLVSPLRSVERSCARSCVAGNRHRLWLCWSVTEKDVLSILFVSHAETVQLAATAVDRLDASDLASSYLTAFFASLEFERILVRSDRGRSLSSFVERVPHNWLGVELVLMTSPEGGHAANRLVEVGIREISKHKQES